jgi:hypothetical protein
VTGDFALGLLVSDLSASCSSCLPEEVADVFI